jgi:hypothetical protein
MDFEKVFEEYMKRREDESWEQVKSKVLLPENIAKQLPFDVNKLLKSAFMIGFDMGSIVGNEEIKNLAKNDPVLFYNWLKSEVDQ